jgi:hypothetical protein
LSFFFFLLPKKIFYCFYQKSLLLSGKRHFYNWIRKLSNSERHTDSESILEILKRIMDSRVVITFSNWCMFCVYNFNLSTTFLHDGV